MDKLKPILAQKFWILSGLCLILPLTGWWVATAGLAKEITDRTTAIETAFKNIPSPGPNDNWTNRVKKFNEDEKRKVKETGELLWTNQLQYMHWPEAVRPGVEEAVQKNGYRGEIDPKTRGDYRYVYDQEIKDALAIVSPYNPEDGSGLVDALIELIPNAGWGTSQIPPSSTEMWDSQEDLWLYRALFQAVANINNNDQTESTSIVEAKIKQISILELRGGTVGGAKPAGGATAGPAAMPGGAAVPGAGQAGPSMPPGGPMGQMGPMGANGMGGTGADAFAASFDPAEQFGPDTDAAGGAVPGAGGPAPASAPPGGGAAVPAAPPQAGPKMGMGMGMGGMGASNVPRKRYIEDNPRFKTRGFYMECVMDHRNLPEFISELSDCGWPLRVIRVQAVDRDLADLNSGVVGTGAGAMATGGMGKSMSAMGAMGGAGAMRNMMPTRSPRGAENEGMAPRSTPRPPSALGPAKSAPGFEAGGAVGEAAVSPEAAMADPYLVNVALSGIITLYKPYVPEGAQPGTPGAPSTTTPPAVGTTAAATPAAPAAPATTVTTPPAAATTPAAAAATKADTAAPATTAEKSATPAEEAKPATPAADATKPAAETPPATTKPEPGKAAPAPATPPAATPAAPAGAAEKPAETKPGTK